MAIEFRKMDVVAANEVHSCFIGDEFQCQAKPRACRRRRSPAIPDRFELAPSHCFVGPDQDVCPSRFSNLYIALSQCLTNMVFNCGSTIWLHFAVFHPSTGLIQAYFQRKRGASR